MIDFQTTHLSKKVEFFGVVEDNNDPMALGRVKVRCFNFHPEDKTLVPTDDLPWALVLHPTTSSAISGIGTHSPIQVGAWVFGFFSDGEDAQSPIVTHTVPGIHRPNSENEVGGGGDCYGYDRPYHQEQIEGKSNETSPSLLNQPNSENHGTGSIIANGDINTMLSSKDKPRFKELGLVTYSGEKAPNGYACKDAAGSLLFHYGTALAFEALTKEFGKGKLFITSAYRSPAYNRAIKGAAAKSLHMSGRAIDVGKNTVGSSQAEIIRFAKLAVKYGFVGFGLYSGFIHIDTGSGRVWNGATASWFKNAIREAGWYEGKKGLSGVNAKKAGDSEFPGKEEDDQIETKPTPDATNNSKDYNPTQGDQTLPRGIRNNNPGNVESGENWEGKTGSDGRFATFSKPEYGIRAAYKVQGTYEEKHGLTTINQRISRWAPPSENNTSAYVNAVSNKMGISPNTPFSIKDPILGPKFMSAVFQHENGTMPYSQTQLESGQRLAFNGETSSLPKSTPQKGFVDPTNHLPTNEYRGTPSTNQLGRGVNRCSNMERIVAKDAGRLTGLPAAGDIGTFGEPELRAGPQYPFNQVTSSKSGHVIELDDTPDVERINIEHRTGSGIEIFANGDMVQRTKSNQYVMTNGDRFDGSLGKHFITSVNDLGIRTTSDMTQHADGSVNIIVGNDGVLTISGDYTIAIGEDMQLKSGGRIKIQGASIDLFADGNLNMEAGGNIGIKAGGALQMESGGDASLKAPTVFMDDAIKMAEGGAKSIEGADTADVGSPGPRKKISKDNLKSSANSGKKIITTEEIMKHYESVRNV